ncbi:MAG TPA: hypothetical protein VFR66_08110 [Burkholderiales bacterium]|nr:hypothetical protein [Burkholderiales bacterium]
MHEDPKFNATRRNVLITGAALAAGIGLPMAAKRPGLSENYRRRVAENGLLQLQPVRSRLSSPERNQGGKMRH